MLRDAGVDERLPDDGVVVQCDCHCVAQGGESHPQFVVLGDLEVVGVAQQVIGYDSVSWLLAA